MVNITAKAIAVLAENSATEGDAEVDICSQNIGLLNVFERPPQRFSKNT